MKLAKRTLPRLTDAPSPSRRRAPVALREPQRSYGSASRTSPRATGLWDLATATSSERAVAAVDRGLPLRAIDELRERLTEPEIDELVIPRRTFNHRRLKGMRLSPDESDKALRVARLITSAIRIFGTPEAAMEWLRDPHPIFDDRRPLALAASEAGARLVENSLARIAWGAAL